MKPFKTEAIIYSLNGVKDTVIVLSETMVTPNQPGYLVDYKGVICTAIYNPFSDCYYADDIYGVVKI